MTAHSPYAYVCATCHHLSSEHGLAETGDLCAGPYICADCGCEVAQDHAVLLLRTVRDYRTFMDNNPEYAQRRAARTEEPTT